MYKIERNFVQKEKRIALIKNKVKQQSLKFNDKNINESRRKTRVG